MGEIVHGSLDRVLELLSNARRRHALCRLEREREMTLPDLADEVAVREHGVELDEIDPRTVTDVYFSLYHCHVPKLRDAGLVEYDQERDMVWLTDAGTDVAGWAVEVAEQWE